MVIGFFYHGGHGEHGEKKRDAPPIFSVLSVTFVVYSPSGSVAATCPP